MMLAHQRPGDQVQCECDPYLCIAMAHPMFHWSPFRYGLRFRVKIRFLAVLASLDKYFLVVLVLISTDPLRDASYKTGEDVPVIGR